MDDLLQLWYRGQTSVVQSAFHPLKGARRVLSLQGRGQWKPPDAELPVFGPSTKVDYELEMGLFMGPGNELGSPIDVKDALKHAFGCVLLNDWSLRDVQLWESQPLGPFVSKSWASTISPWIVTMDALEPFRCNLPAQKPQVLPYLSLDTPQQSYDVQLSVELQPQNSEPVTIATSNLNRSSFLHSYEDYRVRNVFCRYWSFSQMLAHHTVTGCNLRPGDLLGTGTLSSDVPESRGCLLERTKHGAEPVTWSTSNGHSITRAYLEDGDQVTLSGWCEKENATRIGFGKCRGRILE